MGTNTLTSRSDGDRIPASDHNEVVQAMQIDFVPRNNSRVPEDIIGSLGTSVLRWLKSYVKEIFIGTASNNLKIYEGSAGEIWIERSGASDETIKIKDGEMQFLIEGDIQSEITNEGFEGSYARVRSISYDSMSNTKRFDEQTHGSNGSLSGGETLTTVSFAVRSGFNYRFKYQSIIPSGAGAGGWSAIVQVGGGTVFGPFAIGDSSLNHSISTSWSMDFVYTATSTGNITVRWGVSAAGGSQAVESGISWIEEI